MVATTGLQRNSKVKVATGGRIVRSLGVNSRVIREKPSRKMTARPVLLSGRVEFHGLSKSDCDSSAGIVELVEGLLLRGPMSPIILHEGLVIGSIPHVYGMLSAFNEWDVEAVEISELISVRKYYLVMHRPPTDDFGGEIEEDRDKAALASILVPAYKRIRITRRELGYPYVGYRARDQAAKFTGTRTELIASVTTEDILRLNKAWTQDQKPEQKSKMEDLFDNL